MNNTTPRGIMVAIGQVWRDCDKRKSGRERVVVCVDDGYAYMGVSRHDPRPSRIAIRRMYKHSTGWELVK